MSARPRRSAGEPTVLIRDLATNLTHCREEAGLTRDDLAEAAEIGIEHLIELEEAGGTIPSIGVVLRLAGAVGRMPSELVAGSNGSRSRSAWVRVGSRSWRTTSSSPRSSP